MTLSERYLQVPTYEVQFRRILASDMVEQLTVAAILHVFKHTTANKVVTIIILQESLSQGRRIAQAFLLKKLAVL